MIKNAAQKGAFVPVSVSSRWYICALGKAHNMRATPSLRSVLKVAFETIAMFVWLTMALSSFQGRSSSASSFHASLPPGDQWCDVLGFVSTGSVSRFSKTSDLSRKIASSPYHMVSSVTVFSPRGVADVSFVQIALSTCRDNRSKRHNVSCNCFFFLFFFRGVLRSQKP